MQSVLLELQELIYHMKNPQHSQNTIIETNAVGCYDERLTIELFVQSITHLIKDAIVMNWK